MVIKITGGLQQWTTKMMFLAQENLLWSLIHTTDKSRHLIKSFFMFLGFLAIKQLRVDVKCRHEVYRCNLGALGHLAKGETALETTLASDLHFVGC